MANDINDTNESKKINLDNNSNDFFDVPNTSVSDEDLTAAEEAFKTAQLALEQAKASYEAKLHQKQETTRVAQEEAQRRIEEAKKQTQLEIDQKIEEARRQAEEEANRKIEQPKKKAEAKLAAQGVNVSLNLDLGFDTNKEDTKQTITNEQIPTPAVNKTEEVSLDVVSNEEAKKAAARERAAKARAAKAAKAQAKKEAEARLQEEARIKAEQEAKRKAQEYQKQEEARLAKQAVLQRQAEQTAQIKLEESKRIQAERWSETLYLAEKQRQLALKAQEVQQSKSQETSTPIEEEETPEVSTPIFQQEDNNETLVNFPEEPIEENTSEQVEDESIEDTSPIELPVIPEEEVVEDEPIEQPLQQEEPPVEQPSTESKPQKQKKQKAPKDTNKKKSKWPTILIILVIIAALVAFYVLDPFAWFKSNSKQPTSSNEQTIIPTDISDEDLCKQLWEENSAISQNYKGTIMFESGLVYLPFVQGASNDTYYRTNWKTNEYDDQGSIFMDSSNTLDDQNIILIGHYVYPQIDPTGTAMFTPLSKLLEQSNYEANQYVKVFLQNQIRRYQVANVYYCDLITEDNEGTTIQYTPDGYEFFIPNYTEDQFNTYINNVKNSSLYDTGVSIEYSDKFITLQTCVENNDEKREIILLKEIERIDYNQPIETEETIQEEVPAEETPVEENTEVVE